MHFLRKSAVFMAAAILPLLLFLLAANFALQKSFGNPEPVKGIIRDTGIYSSAIDAFLEAANNPNEDGSQGISVDNPVVRDAFKKSFSPELLQNSTEGFIDGIYAWLEGKTPKPEFTIDLTQAKNTFVNEVAAGAEARAGGLPACPRGQNTFEDPFAATCLPRGVSPSVAGDKIRQELAGGDEKFLKDPVITAETIKNDKGQPVFGQSSVLPENYQRLKKAPWVLLGLVVALLATVIFLSEPHAKGLKRAGITLLVVGIVIIGFSFLAGQAINKSLVPNIPFENEDIKEKVQKLVKDTSDSASRNFMIAGGAYAGLGALGVGGSIFLGRRGGASKEAEKAPSKEEKTEDKPKSSSNAASSKK